MTYDLFADRCEGGESQQFGTIELLHQEDNQMIKEIVECLNEYNFRDCVITWAESDVKSYQQRIDRLISRKEKKRW